MQKLHIGITGATGSLGKELLKYKNKFKFIIFKGDIRSRTKLKLWFKKNQFDAVFHFAAVVPIKIVNNNKKKALQVNYFGTKNIIDEICNNEINWFFFSSTSHVYSSSKKKINENFKINPISYYGKTKKLAENYIIKKLKKRKTKYCIGRIFSTTNKNQKKNYLVPDLKRRIKDTNGEIILQNLNHYRDFISIKDLAKIIIFLYKKNYEGVINLGTGSATHLKNIAKIIARKYKKRVNFLDNKISTYLVADISSLKKIYKFKLSKKIKEHIF